jgi:hypothetical protein
MRARIVRMSDDTKIALDISGLPADTPSINLYAVDSFGRTTMLGPVTLTNGVAQQTYVTNLNRFMLVLSPNPNLETYSRTQLLPSAATYLPVLPSFR